ncbi:hypothetical protein R1flu_003054 [Riccia fluitans]|uniref:Uncharacterized protein n=1 Tax=Riccia fluitans TaxID=41844 RepID=A0ABD1YBN0_9MARC
MEDQAQLGGGGGKEFVSPLALDQSAWTLVLQSVHSGHGAGGTHTNTQTSPQGEFFEVSRLACTQDGLALRWLRRFEFWAFVVLIALAGRVLLLGCFSISARVFEHFACEHSSLVSLFPSGSCRLCLSPGSAEFLLALEFRLGWPRGSFLVLPTCWFHTWEGVGSVRQRAFLPADLPVASHAFATSASAPNGVHLLMSTSEGSGPTFDHYFG